MPYLNRYNKTHQPMRLNYFVLLFAVMFFCHQSYSQYKEGYYYTKDGAKVNGLLRLEYGDHLFRSKENGDCFISFKETREDKRVRLTTADICCFVIETDSFAVIKNFDLNFAVSYPRDFAQVLQDGKIKLYLYYSIASTMGSGGMMYSRNIRDWVIEKDGQVEKLTKKAFKRLMLAYLEDYPELKEKVESKELRYRDAPEIIKAYNEHFMPAKTQDTTHESASASH